MLLLGCGNVVLGATDEELPARVGEGSAEDEVEVEAALDAGELGGTVAGGAESPSDDLPSILLGAGSRGGVDAGASGPGALTTDDFFSSLAAMTGAPAEC